MSLAIVRVWGGDHGPATSHLVTYVHYLVSVRNMFYPRTGVLARFDVKWPNSKESVAWFDFWVPDSATARTNRARVIRSVGLLSGRQSALRESENSPQIEASHGAQAEHQTGKGRTDRPRSGADPYSPTAVVEATHKQN
jgi:hypothetical protein